MSGVALSAFSGHIIPPAIRGPDQLGCCGDHRQCSLVKFSRRYGASRYRGCRNICGCQDEGFEVSRSARWSLPIARAACLVRSLPKSRRGLIQGRGQRRCCRCLAVTRNQAVRVLRVLDTVCAVLQTRDFCASECLATRGVLLRTRVNWKEEREDTCVE